MRPRARRRARARRHYTITLPRHHAGQQTVLAGRRQFNAVTCGRRWGKTTGLGVPLIVETASAGWPTGWFAPTYKMLADAWRILLRALDPLITRRDAQERRIELATGGTIDFWTLDNPDAGRGRKYKLGVIDEAAMVKDIRAAFLAAILPTLSDLEGEAWLLTTPRGFDEYHALTRKFDEWPNGATFRMPTSTNPYISPAFLAAAREVMGEKLYAQEYDASFESLAGRVIHAFDYHENVVENDYTPFPDSGPIFVGMDFNVNPMTASIAFPYERFEVVRDPLTGKRVRRAYDELVFEDVIELRDSGTEEMCEELKRRIPKPRWKDITVYPDPTGNARQTSAKRGVTNFTLIEEAGLRWDADDVPLLEDKFNEINALCCTASGRRRLKVKRRCTALIKCFEQYVYKENSSTPDKGKFDHFIDGVGNIIHREFPLVTDNFDLEEAFGV